jgi:hypothetical protein
MSSNFASIFCGIVFFRQPHLGEMPERPKPPRHLQTGTAGRSPSWPAKEAGWGAWGNCF